MDHSATLTSKGQITLPSRMRKELGLKAGDKVAFVEDEKGSYRIEVRKHSFADLRGIVKTKKPIASSDIDRWIEEARAARGGSKRA